MLNFVGIRGARVDPQRHNSVVRFGTYEVGLQSGELRKAGVRIRVQQQPLKLLEILLERPGEVVTREELRSRIWPDESFGDFDQAVNVAVAKLRAALGDSADNPRYVETLPRRGYRFIAEVAVVNLPAGKLESAPDVGASAVEEAAPVEVGGKVLQSKAMPGQHAWKMWLLALLLPLLALVAWMLIPRIRQQANIASPDPVRSLAVLPLENLSSDSQDYFADGMTDELITDLAQISALRVISRTSIMPYKGVRKPLSQIAHELNVDAVVEGTVLRSGDQVRITAQLIRAPADKHLWAQSYEGDVRDTLALQKRVARTIAEQIRITLTPHEAAVLENVKAVNPEAYEDYLKGRYFWSKRSADGSKKAIDYFSQAIASDPNYALPHAGLADIYELSDSPQLARQEVQKALSLDDQSAEAHNSLASLLYLFDRDSEGADREFKRALELDHNYAPAHHWYSMYLALEGRKQEALAEAEKAYELDPLSPVVGANLAKILQEAGQDDKAIEQAHKTLDLEPDSAVTHAVLGIIYESKRMYAEAIAEYKKALQLGGSTAEMHGLLGYCYAVSGNRSEAEKMIVELKALLPTHSRAALDLAVVFSGLGDKENALNWLGKAEELHVGDLIGIGKNPHFVELGSDRRFQALLQRVRAPK
ncbi:MAG TPA: winged helix-turn-helix domain-containing protein [Candidatus Sulfotelmatobacter sp.]|nr:winged helix-turn-helix domain-containing protein [Candidatus Sulfotelmatobacter sp.]